MPASYDEQDRLLIDKIEKQFDLEKAEDLFKVHAMIGRGTIIFHSKEGTRFEEQISKKVQMIRAQRTEETKKKATLKSEFREKLETEEIAETSNGTAKKRKKKKVVVYTKKEYFLRTVVLSVLLLLSLTFLGYFLLYSYKAHKVDVANKKLENIKDNQTINDMYGDEVVEEVVDGQTKYFKVLDDYKALYNQNKNLIGWIEIADIIDGLPVVQTLAANEENFYLDHNLQLEEDRNGTLFMDRDCDVKLPSDNLIIYGHNMRSGKMFGSLSKYESKTFYENHKIITFDSIYEKGQYEVMYVFRSHIYKEDEIVFKYYQFINANSKEEFASNMAEMEQLSFYDTGVKAEFGDKLLTLSTCDYEEEAGRFVVVAKRVK